MPPNREHPDWQGIWERLRKLGLEFDYDRRNGIVEAFERLYNPAPVGWRSLFERYVVGDAEVHVHIRTRASVLPDVLEASNLCATFAWPRRVLLNDSEHKFWCSGTHHDGSNIVEHDEEVGEMKVAVLVDVPEFIENRKRLFGRILPTVKRLQLLDDCAKVWPDSPEATRHLFPRPAGPPMSPGDASTRAVSVARVRGEDGEGDVSPLAPRFSPPRDRVGWGVPVGDGELPDEVVERGAEIVDDISDDGPPRFDGGSASPSMNTSAVCQSSLVSTLYELISSANDLTRSLRKSRCTFARLTLAQHPLKSGWWVMTNTMEAL
jgi:hypothetical protein